MSTRATVSLTCPSRHGLGAASGSDPFSLRRPERRSLPARLAIWMQCVVRALSLERRVVVAWGLAEVPGERSGSVGKFPRDLRMPWAFPRLRAEPALLEAEGGFWLKRAPVPAHHHQGPPAAPLAGHVKTSARLHRAPSLPPFFVHSGRMLFLSARTAQRERFPCRRAGQFLVRIFLDHRYHDVDLFQCVFPAAHGVFTVRLQVANPACKGALVNVSMHCVPHNLSKV